MFKDSNMYQPIDQAFGDAPFHTQRRPAYKKWLTPKGWRFWGVVLFIVFLIWFYNIHKKPQELPIVTPTTQQPPPGAGSTFTTTMQITTGFNNNDPLGTVKIQFIRDWAPIGYDRVLELMNSGFYKDAAFFRVLPNFIAQFGINADPAVQAKWENANIKDDPTGKQSNLARTVTFATAGADTRTCQLFVNYGDNKFLDKSGFAPVGKVTEGYEVLLKLYAEYGEGKPEGNGPEQGKLVKEGNKYLREEYPKLSFISNVNVEFDKKN